MTPSFNAIDTFDNTHPTHADSLLRLCPDHTGPFDFHRVFEVQKAHMAGHCNHSGCTGSLLVAALYRSYHGENQIAIG